MNATIAKTKEILDLRRRILGTETGITIRDVQSIYGICRRSAERRLHAILNVDAHVDKWTKRNDAYVRYGRTGGNGNAKTTI
ncbi:hypothetical protein IJ541_07230 [bacterium]|nr:hypothetical protein [bacterium]